jgi:hypothetical protein
VEGSQALKKSTCAGATTLEIFNSEHDKLSIVRLQDGWKRLMAAVG